MEGTPKLPETARDADSVADELAFAKDVGDCFECYCHEDFLDDDGAWTGEHDDECNRESARAATLWALEKLHGKWGVVRLNDGAGDGS